MTERIDPADYPSCEACGHRVPTARHTRFCNIECKDWWHYRNGPARAVRRWVIGTDADVYTVRCWSCVQPFTVKRSDAHYCSSRCRTKAQREGRTQDIAPMTEVGGK